MADPLSIEDFADKLRIQTVAWQLQRWDEYSGVGNGDVLAAQLAPPRWLAKVTLGSMYHAEAAQVQALIEGLDGPLSNFYLYAPQMPFPQADPKGERLGGAAPKIASLPGNNKSLSLNGLPDGYVLTIGDMLAYDYGSNPTRRALLRVLATVVANSAGVTPSFEVRPHIPAGTTVGAPVLLKKPAAKVFIVPGSFDPGVSRALITEGMSFEVMQRP